MRRFVQHLSIDVQTGRESWRVFAAASFMSFAAAAILVVARIP